MSTRKQKLAERALKRVGSVLGNEWKLERLIGVGGMAAVYEATHCNRGGKAAIKLLHGELALDPNVCSRFLREGYLANSVGHPGAVRVHDDHLSDDGSAYLVMELLRGETVEARWVRHDRRLALGEVLWIADRLLEVLEAAHSKGIVHRDIKPENLFLTVEGSLKVLDFGIARLREAELDGAITLTGRSMGTPAYMAPEQARGLWEEVDHRADQWSVGATLFSLLTGRLVHEAKTPDEALAKAMSEGAPSIARVMPQLPVAFGRVLDRSLAFRRTDRFADVTELRQRLKSATRGIAELKPEAAPSLRHPESLARLGARAQAPRSDLHAPHRRRKPWTVFVAIVAGSGGMLALHGLLWPDFGLRSLASGVDPGPMPSNVATPATQPSQPFRGARPSPAARYGTSSVPPLAGAGAGGGGATPALPGSSKAPPSESRPRRR